MGRQVSKHKRRLEEEDEEIVREDYVQRMRDNYPLIIRTLMHDLIVSIDKAGDLVFLNDAAAEFWGTSSEDIIGTPFFDYLHPEDVKRTQVAFQEIIKSKGQVKDLIARVNSSRGSRKVAWNAVAIFDEAGTYMGIQATGKDLTDLLQAEEELEQSRSHFRRLFEVIVDPIVIVDLTGTILEFSQSAEEILGFPRDELVGKHFLETKVATDDTKAIMIRNLERIRRGIYIPPYAIETVAKDGRKLFYEVNPTRIVYKGEPAILAIFRNLTEQKKAEEKFRASEERFKYFIENAPEAIWVQDVNGIFIDGNKRAEELTGYKREELIGKNMLDILVSPESVPRLLEAFKPNKLGEISGPNEVEMIKKDGSMVYFEASTIPIEREGKVEIIGVARDITERKRAEEELIRLSNAVRMSNDSIVISDLNGTILDVNEASLKMHGTDDKSDLIGTNAFDIVVPEEREKALAGMKEVLEKGHIQSQEYNVITKDGSEIPVEMSIAIMKDADGKAIGFVAISRDITERKKAVEALRESEEKYRSIINAMNDTAWVIDFDGKFIDVNDTAVKVLGYTREELLSMGPTDIDNALTPEQIKDLVNRMKYNEELQVFETTHITKDGKTFPIEISSSLVTFNGKPAILSIARDITDRKKAEEALKKSEKRFRSTLDGMLEGCQIVDYNWRYRYVNNAAVKHGRLTKKGLIGKTMMEVHPGIEKTKLFPVLRRCMKDRVSAHLEHEFTFPNGESSWFELSIEPVPEGIFILTIDISDRKEIEEALRQEQEMLETVTGNINAGLAIISKDYRILWANEVLRGYLGEVEGKTCYSALHKRKSICPSCGVTEIFETGKDLVIHEQEATSPVGKIWLELTATAIRDESGEIVAASEMSLDITKRKKTEIALKESLHKFKTIFEGATDGIAAIEPETMNLVFVNPRMAEITGFPMDELLKSTILDYVPKDEVPLTMERFRKQLEGKLDVVRNQTILKKDNTRVYVDINAKLLTIGNQQYIVGFLRDVTEQKKTQEALLESEKKYRDMINAMNDTALVLDFDANIIDANQTAVKVLGYSKEELLSMKVQQFDASLTAETIRDLNEKLKTRGLLVFETTHTTKDGRTFPVEISATQVTYQGKPAILSIARDITERKRAQEAISEANHLLKQSNKELENYTYIVSHDLKAPLRTIRSFGSFLLEDYEDKLDETGKDYLHRMVNASSHMDSMIEDLLVLSRVGRKFTEVEKVDLNKLLNEILADLEATIKERNAKVIVDKLPTLHVHRVWERQLFTNLISNALKFNESKTPKIEVLYEERENDYLFKIRDNGIGIEKKYLERIFNLFERAPTEKKYDGTGAGLAICKKIVEHRGGKIWAESTPGKGSTFFFTIPKRGVK